MRFEDAAVGQRRRFVRRAPRVALLWGSVSQEDSAYVRLTPDAELSYRDVAGALTRLGAAEVRIVEVTPSNSWMRGIGGVDLAFVNLHGAPGEDGSIQAVLAIHGIPFVGSAVEASVVCLNKYLTKLVAVSVGVRTPAYALLRDGETVACVPALPGEDLICKPLRGGSSMDVHRIPGVHRAPVRGEWIIEAFHPGDDVTVTVVETAGRAVALPAVAQTHSGPFYDFAAKMGVAAGERATAARPARLLASLAECERMAVTMHRHTGARHVSRSDFVVAGGTPYFLELNTIPGLSAVSNSATCAYAAGLSYDDLIALVAGAALDGCATPPAGGAGPGAASR